MWIKFKICYHSLTIFDPNLISGDGASDASHAAVAPSQDLGRHLPAVPDDLLVVDHVRLVRPVAHLRARDREAQSDACKGKLNAKRFRQPLFKLQINSTSLPFEFIIHSFYFSITRGPHSAVN